MCNNGDLVVPKIVCSEENPQGFWFQLQVNKTLASDKIAVFRIEMLTIEEIKKILGVE